MLIEALNGFLMTLPDIIFQSRLRHGTIVQISKLEFFISSSGATTRAGGSRSKLAHFMRRLNTWWRFSISVNHRKAQ